MVVFYSYLCRFLKFFKTTSVNSLSLKMDISLCSEVLDGIVALFFFPEAEVLFQKLDN